MIKPDEIKEIALKWWQPFLVSYVNNTPFFPKQIDRIGKVKPGDITRQFEVLQNEIENLYKQSKNTTGIGYFVKVADRNFRRSGTHQLPDTIEFQTEEDFLSYTGKKKEWMRFKECNDLLTTQIPSLKEWIVANPLLLCSPSTEWYNIIKVCKYFLENPQPNLYIRQLPIEVNTKFIEQNSYLLISLLDFLIPLHVRNAGQKRFAERYHLKHDEPLIRIRILDPCLAVGNGILDLSIKLSDFEKSEWICSTVIITENKMNFLTLPDFESSIAIWSGGGFNISYLKNVHWLNSKNIHYWGDIDEHGFQILHQIRCYFPQTKSVMMDKATFNMFQGFAAKGERCSAIHLNLLTTAEIELYALLKTKENKNRLEQEKIPQYYTDEQLNKLFGR